MLCCKSPSRWSGTIPGEGTKQTKKETALGSEIIGEAGMPPAQVVGHFEL